MNASEGRCWIMYMDGLLAVTLLHAHGRYLGPISHHVIRFYNIWVRFIKPNSWFSCAVHILYFNFAVSSLHYFTRMSLPI